MADQAQTVASGVVTLAESRRARRRVIFLLYLAQGVPIGLFFVALPGWLAAEGGGAGAVGPFLTATSLPWSLKIINGVLMDRFAFLPMGRRRAWLIGAQATIVIVLLLMAAASPASSDVALLSAFSFAANTATAFQDVAIDGMAVDLVPDEEKSDINGIMFGAQTLGLAGSGALAAWLIDTVGLAAALLVPATFVALVLSAIVLVRERPGERRLPWSEGEASPAARAAARHALWPILRDTLRAVLGRRSLCLVLVILSAGTIHGLYVGGLPLLGAEVADWSASRYGSVSSQSSLLAGLLGLFLLGRLADRLGNGRTMALGFVLLALLGAAGATAAAASSGAALPALVGAFYIADVGLKVAFCALAMRLSQTSVAATQFTLYMALLNLGMALGAALLKGLEDIGGLTAVFAGLAVTAFFGLLAVGGAIRHG